MTSAESSLHAGRGRRSGGRYRVALVALTLATFMLYLTRIEAKGIWWDESLSLYRARLSVPEILSNRITYGTVTTVDLHPPLYFLLLRGLTRMLGESDTVLRLLSACAGTLLVPLLYATGTRLRGSRAGALAALYGAGSPLILWYAQEARMYTLVTLFCVLTFYCLWRAVAEGRASWALGAAASTGAALATQYLSALVLGALAAVAVAIGLARHARVPGAPGSGRGRWVGVAATALVLAIALWYGRTALSVLSQPAAGREYVPLREMLRDALNSFSLGATVDPRTVLPLNLCFLAVYAAGVVSLWRRPPAPLCAEGGASRAARLAGPLALVALVLVPIGGMWVYSLVIGPIYMGSRYVIMSLPFFTLGLAIGTDAIVRWRAVAGWLVAALLMASMGVSDVRYFAHPAYAAKEDHRATAEYVMAEEAPGDAIVLTAPENITAFEHYYHGRLPVYQVPSVALSGAQPPERIAAEMSAVVERGYRRLWLVHCRTLHSDPEDSVLAWLEQHALLLERVVYPSVGSTATVSAWLPGSPISDGPPPGEPLAVFGGRLALESLVLESEQSPTPVAVTADGSPRAAALPVEAGRSLLARACWRPRAALGRYKASLRLVDGAGAVWAQSDREPYMYLPTDEWQVGSAIQHDMHLRVRAGTPPGTYRLLLVLYEDATGQALAYGPAGSTADGATLEVGQITVRRSATPSSQSAVLVPGVERAAVSARFGPDLGLWAWHVAPEALPPGGRLFLNLFWEARRSPAEDYVLVVNLADEGGRVWHTSQRALTGVDWPAIQWRAGESFRGIVPIDVPPDAPAGLHSVHVLVYAPDAQRFLGVGRSLLPFAGREVTVGKFMVTQ